MKGVEVKAVAKTVAALVREDELAVVPLQSGVEGRVLGGFEGEPFKVDQRGVEKCVKVFVWDRKLEGGKAVVATTDEEGVVWLRAAVLKEAS